MTKFIKTSREETEVKILAILSQHLVHKIVTRWKVFFVGFGISIPQLI
jgi:hypothetical protein